MLCNREIETMPHEAMGQLQTEKLKKIIKWVYEKSPFYQAQMQSVGLKPSDIQSLKDLRKMPFTTKEQLIEQSPYGFLTGPMSSTIRMRMVDEVQPLIRGYSSGDVGRNVELTARALVAGGLNMASVMQICGDYSSENALNLHYAAEVLGATIVPTNVSNLEQQIQLIDKLGVTVLASDSKHLLQLLVAGQALDVDLSKSTIETIFCLHDRMKNDMAKHFSGRYNANIYNIYSPPELGGTGMFFECEEKCGMHVQEDCFYVEIINLTDGTNIEDSRMGELVITTLAADAMPVIRYCTGQVVSLEHKPCKCGRTSARIIVP